MEGIGQFNPAALFEAEERFDHIMFSTANYSRDIFRVVKDAGE